MCWGNALTPNRSCCVQALIVLPPHGVSLTGCLMNSKQGLGTVLSAFVVFGVSIAVLPAVVYAQGAAIPGLPTTSAVRPVTRADLAAAYLRLDHVMAVKTLDDSTRASVSKAFDRSTLAFFAGKFASAVGTIDSLTVALNGAPIGAPPEPRARVVRGKSPSVARDALLARMARLDSTGPLAQAMVSARARASLLVDVPSADRSAEFLADPVTLAAALEREVRALESGKNPYAKYAGDLWRSFRGVNGVIVPYRLVATKAVANAATPVAVVLALHGAGADENAFVDAYGAGISPRLAGERGMLFVSPATIAFAASAENVDLLLAQLRSEYNIDTARVYVMGHSMGASAVAKLVGLRPNVFAAAACLAGGAPVTAAGAPPMLFLGGELDLLIAAKNVQAFAAATPTAEYRLVPHEGHTMMVAAGVRTAIPWMLERRR